MPPTPPETPLDRSARPRWPWIALVLALLWIVAVRVPLVLNARAHLDSDLAVDGLTLIDALEGNWRWHYPGTPHIGTPAVLLSLPQAALFGAGPETLVSGGVVAYALTVILTFSLAWRAFGPSVAAWGLVPLAFASIGTVWLSGRITGGHLLAAAWNAGAFLLLLELLRRGGPARAAALGLACGLGLYADRLFLFTVAGLLPALLAGGFGPGSGLLRLAAGAAFAVGLGLGYLPHVVGARVEPHDAYETQFATILGDERTGRINWPQTRALAGEHARILFLDCLPRLIGGRRLPGFQSEPAVEALSGRPRRGDAPEYAPIPMAATVFGLSLFAAAIVALTVARRREDDLAAEAVRWGLLFASAATLAGFLVNRNIYNSDNYRYLVALLAPWSLGFGLLFASLWRRGSGGRAVAVILAGALAVSATLDTARWYRGFGWMDAAGRPVRQHPDEPALDWLAANPEVDQIYGGYWDVYRLAFLTGGRIQGVPYPEYPDRFPEIADALPGHRPRVLVVARPDPISRFNLRVAKETGGTVLYEDRGLTVIDWPVDMPRRGERP